jgi:choline kinase
MMEALGNPRDLVSTALLLAAGTGSRLQPLTDDAPKCLTMVNEKTILERLVEGLRTSGIERLIMVVGYLDHCIREYLSNLNTDLSIE